MRKKFYLLVLCVAFFSLASTSIHAQWARAYGGSLIEYAKCIQQTSDGGYIVVGDNEPFGGSGRIFLVLKLDSTGIIEWQRTYSGSANDLSYVWSIQQTSEGGYLLAGDTDSFGENRDIWILKLTSNGAIEWQRTYGGADYEHLYSLQQTLDGGYIAVNGINWDNIWILKLKSNGDIEWQRIYDGNGNESGRSIQQTLDGGYIIAGDTDWPGPGNRDFLIIKLDSSGANEWQYMYGGPRRDRAESIQQTADGCYIVAGYSNSFGASEDDSDFWVLKLDSSGAIDWQKRYGGTGYEWPSCVLQTGDGNYVVAGETSSYGAGMDDIWVLNLNTDGTIKWQRTYGGSNAEFARSIQQTSEGGYIFTGNTESFGAGQVDFVVIKTTSTGIIDPSENTFVRNSNSQASDTNVSPADLVLVPLTANLSYQNTSITPQSSNASNYLILKGPDPPNAPIRLRAKALSWKKIRIKWKDKATDEKGFVIERRKSDEEVWEEIKKTKANVNKYNNKKLEANTKYLYRVRAFNLIGYSEYSNTAKAKTKKR